MTRPTAPRRLAILLALVPALAPALGTVGSLPALAAPAPQTRPLVTAAVPESFSFSGGGWGHGVGMSQYGAQAQALAGRSAAQILAYYYRGASVSAVPDDVTVRVQVLGGVRTARLTSTGLGGLGGGRFRVAVGALTLAGRTGDTLNVAAVPGGVRAWLEPVAAGGPGAPRVAVGPGALVRWEGTRALAGEPTVVDVPGAGGRYRRGTLDVRPVDGRLTVVNVLRLHDEYLDGIAEVPSSWAPATLQAQAMAARTYAVRAMASGVRASCSCHLYDEVTSQKFTGWRKEGEPGWGARWVAAVRATSPSPTTGQVVTYGGRPIEALYFSSDGGRTENSEDVWSATVPYLRSVPDPWSASARNPMASWTRTVSQARVAAAFGLPDVAVLDLTDRTEGGSVRSARAVSSAGESATISGGRFVGRLGLPARWIFRTVQQVDGAGAWARTLAVARAAAPGARTAVLVAGGQAAVWDGVAAAPLARTLAGPLLVVPPGTAPDTVAAALRSRGVTRAVLVGAASTAALTQAIRARGVDVRRFAGADPYATSALVAAQVVSRSGVPAGRRAAVAVPVAPRTVDAALAAAAVAAGAGRPVLLVRPTGAVPAPVAAAARSLGIASSVCVGTAGALAETVRRALPACTRVTAASGVALSVALARTVRGATAWRGVTLAPPAAAGLPEAVSALALGQPLVRVGAAAPADAVRYLQSTPALGRLTVVGPVPAGAVSVLRRS